MIAETATPTSREILMNRFAAIAFALSLAILAPVAAADVPAQDNAAKPTYDAALAKRTGADERGMRPYVLVILKTGPKRMPDGEGRKPH